MEASTNNSQILLVVVQHPVLGAQLVPYMYKSHSEGKIELLEQAFHAAPSTLQQLSKPCRDIIAAAESYSEKKLMAIYSKEKTVNAFLKKLDEKILKTVVRPFIEKKLVEIINTARLNNINIYQHTPGKKILYSHNAYRTSPHFTEVSFVFRADDKHFSYAAMFGRGGEEISLQDKKPVLTLTASPAILTVGNELHVFHDIQSMRILPFTNRSVVSVDISQLDKYLANVVYPIVKHHDVETHGLPVYREERPCETRLSVEDTVLDVPVLKLTFAYGTDTFYPGSPFKEKQVRLADENGRKAIYYYHRDRTTEETARKQLEQSGLQLVNDRYYRLRPSNPLTDLTEWILQNKQLLTTGFNLISMENGSQYCLDEIELEEGITETNDWFELRTVVVVGGFRIPFVKFRRHLLGNIRQYLLPDGRILLLPLEWFAKYADVMEYSEKDESVLRLKRAFVGVIRNMEAFTRKDSLAYQQKENLNPPKALKATLREYQKEGFNWMMHLNRNHLNGCLADDMGLGKTLQTLTVLQQVYADENVQTTAKAPETVQKSYGAHAQLSLFFADEPEDSAIPASLIVVPTSLLHNWRKEATRFTNLRILEFAGGSIAMHQQFHRHQLVLTTYGIMRNYIDMLSQYTFEYVVLDESQNIKNSDSLTFKAATRLQAAHRLVLTGTPIENSLKDLWSQFHFLQPELLGSEESFQKNFILPVKQGNKQAEERLLKLISPFILRRSKQEVAPELPQLTEETWYCNMTDAQSDLYQHEKNSLRNILLQQSTDGKPAGNFVVLNGIMRLRQLASHPALVDPAFTHTSGKLQDITDAYEILRSSGHKVLIFSSFVKHLELVAQAFEAHGWQYAMLTGTTQNREAEIERFNTSDEMGAFLISLKAGGVGLNLTRADYVFIIDPWWNPAAEMQAISRAHRIGQDKHVIAYRFITQDSIEEKIIRLQENKRRLSETFVNDSNPFDKLNDDEWAELLR